ncbi:MAG: hypothetical protein U0Y10_11095 [Spirosomataceae bacterium]
MELLMDLLKIVLPAGLVLYAMYLTVRTFVSKQFAEKQFDLKAETARTLLPIRLQAYERMTLFLERISPNNLLLRTYGQATTVLEFQQLLLSEIREEFNHNLSQQVYMSHEAWELIRQAVNQVMTVVNAASQSVAPEAPAIELSRRIFDILLQQQIDPTAEALHFIKDEVKANFM